MPTAPKAPLAHRIWQPIDPAPDNWLGGQIYYYCPSCHNVIGLAHETAPVCPECGRTGLEDIFTEMLSRLKHAWQFFETTRYTNDQWLFKHEPNATTYSLYATAIMALGTYGELRGMNIQSPWGNDAEILRAFRADIDKHLNPDTNLIEGPIGGEAPSGDIVSPFSYLSSGYSRVLQKLKTVGLIAEDEPVYRIDAGGHADEDHLRSRESFEAYVHSEAEHWRKNPWGAGSWMWRAVTNHRERRLAAGEDLDDEMVETAHRWLDEFQDSETGVWGGETAPHHVVVNGIFKVLSIYEECGWAIRHKEKLVDYVLAGADARKGFTGRGCTVFDPMMVLDVLRGRGCNYRRPETDEAAARTFLTFLDNWDAERGWYKEGSWNGKHNNAVPAFMARLLLRQGEHPRAPQR